jgi:hypothetical protein
MPRRQAVALLAAGVHHAQRGILEHALLAVALGAGGSVWSLGTSCQRTSTSGRS